MKTKVFTLLLAVVIMAGVVAAAQASTQPAANTTPVIRADPAVTADQCDSPTQTVTIKTAQTSDGGLAFSPNSINIDKGACVKVQLQNPLGEDHDFDVRKAENNGLVEDVHAEFPLDPTWTNVSTNIQFPNQDAEILWFCQITGHRAAGMEGTFVVGAGTSNKTPGFGIFAASAALFAAVAIPMYRRKLD